MNYPHVYIFSIQILSNVICYSDFIQLILVYHVNAQAAAYIHICQDAFVDLAPVYKKLIFEMWTFSSQVGCLVCCAQIVILHHNHVTAGLTSEFQEQTEKSECAFVQRALFLKN